MNRKELELISGREWLTQQVSISAETKTITFSQGAFSSSTSKETIVVKIIADDDIVIHPTAATASAGFLIKANVEHTLLVRGLTSISAYCAGSSKKIYVQEIVG